MCLYVETPSTRLSEGESTARTNHQCWGCFRTIRPGEVYRWWVTKHYGDGVETEKMCPHCWQVITLGSEMTGCPKQWWWDFLYDDDPTMGFVANVLYDEGHELSDDQRDLMLACALWGRRDWTDDSGDLVAIPTMNGSGGRHAEV